MLERIGNVLYAFCLFAGALFVLFAIFHQHSGPEKQGITITSLAIGFSVWVLGWLIRYILAGRADISVSFSKK